MQTGKEYTINYYGKNDYGTGPYMPTGATATPTADRPSNWSWQSVVAQDKPIKLTANEWNLFCNRIDAFRDYTGREAWGGFLPVKSGTVISADIVNQARAAIAPMTTAKPIPAWINPGDTITADYFNKLRDFLNSVP